MNEEREKVLRMLKEGKISIEEADALLEALMDGGSAASQPIPEMLASPRGDFKTDLEQVIRDLASSIPRDVLREIKIHLKGSKFEGSAKTGRSWGGPEFFDVLQGLWGLAEGHADATVDEPMAAGERFIVTNAWGDVQLSASTDGYLHLKARKRVWAATSEEAVQMASALPIALRRQGTHVTLAVPRLEGRRVRVDLELAVPGDVAVELRLAKGDIGASNLEGALEIHVARGDVHVLKQQGPVQISVASGDLNLTEIVGDLHIDVKSGDVTVEKLQGKIDGRVVHGDVDVRGCAGASIEVVNGDLGLSEVSGDVSVEGKHGDMRLDGLHSNHSVRAHAISGDVVVALTDLAQDSLVSIETMSGDLELALPPDARATVDAAVRSGDLTCSPPLLGLSADRRSLRGVFNAPGATIILRTTSGDIDIRSVTA